MENMEKFQSSKAMVLTLGERGGIGDSQGGQDLQEEKQKVV